jgi:hypothetical protein
MKSATSRDCTPTRARRHPILASQQFRSVSPPLVRECSLDCATACGGRILRLDTATLITAGTGEAAELGLLKAAPKISKQWNSRTSGIKAVEWRVAPGLPDILLTPPVSLKPPSLSRSDLFVGFTD